MTELLVLDRVSRRFVTRSETVVAVDEVTLRVEPGEVVGLAGPSGSGKSTLLHLVLGWEEPDDGSVRRSTDVASLRGWSGVAAVPQELGLLDELTAQQNVELAMRLSGGDHSTAFDAMSRLGLGELTGRSPDELSLGEQQRVAVARAIVAVPRLVVADEPTAHQDERNGDLVMAALTDVVRGGGAVLVATHDERVLASVDRVVRLEDGRVV